MITTPVQQPDPNNAVWNGRQVVAALVHQPGHWQCYTTINGVWWRMEGPNNRGVMANPFLVQSAVSRIMHLAFSV
jgi:hypothetical protein